MSKGTVIFKDGHEEKILSYRRFGDSIDLYTESGKYICGEYISYRLDGSPYKKRVFYKEEALIDEQYGRSEAVYTTVDYIDSMYFIDGEDGINDQDSNVFEC